MDRFFVRAAYDDPNVAYDDPIVQYDGGETRTWDASDTAPWSATSDGPGGASVPGASDRAIFDDKSPSCLMAVGVDPTISQLELRTGFTGTLDVNDNDMTVSGTNSVLIDAGTLDMGNGTWLLNNGSFTTVWTFNAGTGNAEGSLVKLTSSNRTIDSGTMIFNDIEINQPSNRSTTITGTMFVTGTFTIVSTSGILTGTVDLKGDLKSTDTSGGHTTLFKLTTATSQDVFVDKSGGDARFPRIEIDATGTVNLFDTIRVFANITATNWKRTAGSVVVGTSEVVFDNDTSATFTVEDTVTNFNLVRFSCRDTNGNIVITGTLKCDGNLNIESGNNFIGTVDLKGDLTSTATVLQGTGLIRMIGTTPQKIKVDEAGGTGTIPSIELASSSTITFFDNLKIRRGASGDFITNTSGTIDLGTSNIIFDKTTTGIATINAGSMKFNDVTYNCSNANGDISITGTLDIDGKFTITSVDNANGTITLAGNLKSTDTTVTGTGSITFDGIGIQTIDTNGGLGRFPNGTFINNNLGDTVQLSNGALVLNAVGQDFVVNPGARFCSGGFDVTVDDLNTNNGTFQKFAGDTISPVPAPNGPVTVTTCGLQDMDDDGVLTSFGTFFKIGMVKR